jgi:hypothetical protein
MHCCFLFVFGTGLLVVFTGANKVFQEPICATTGQMPVFLKTLSASALIAAFPYAVEER